MIRKDLPYAAPCFRAPEISGLAWKTVSPSDVEGRGWKDTAAPFDRMPARAEKLLPGVWGNCHSTTGMCFEFTTDSTAVAVRTELGEDAYGERNFNATAHSGVDLYVWDECQARWRWASAAQHFVSFARITEYALVWNLSPKKRRYRMYLPFRNQLLSLAVGYDEDTTLQLQPPRQTPPLVYYGTSIIHGAFGTRSGLGVPQILGRALDIPVINLGFSGAARMELEMASFLAEIDAGIYVCDAYHNMTAQLVRDNAEKFIVRLCTLRPDTPLFVLGAPPVLNAWLYPDIQAGEDEKNRLFAEISAPLEKRFPNFHFIPGEDFYGSDEVSLDGIHPNDHAFANMADALAPVLAPFAQTLKS